MGKLLTILFICLCSFFSLQLSAAAPQSAAEAEQQIKALQKELKSLGVWLEEVQSEKSQIEGQLEGKEKSINELLKQIKTIQDNIKQSDGQLKELANKQRSLKINIQQQNQQIAAQIRAVYRSGEQEGMKFLLDGRTPEEIVRMVRYNRYFSQARQSLINGYGIQVNELSLIEKSMRSHRAQQAREEARLAEERKVLAKQQKERHQILVKLQKDLRTGGKKAASLKRNQQQLKALLLKLEEALAEMPVIDDNVAFGSLKGKLNKPLGRINVLRESGQVNLGGVTLSAKEGTQVNAVYHGRVIFSDWLRGFGLVLILDHGDGYMSLYGYNQSLLKEVGEWVNTNDPIATVGSSGGRTIPGLFFSIRHNGTPVNPLKWVKQG